MLAAGHGDRIIVKDFIGDVGPRCYSGPDRLNARMVIGTVPEVLEHMIAL